MTVKPQIALFANKASKQLAEIARAVEDEGASAFVFDIQLGGNDRNTLAVDPSNGLRWGGFSFNRFYSVHIRCTAPRTLPTLPPVLNEMSYAQYRSDYVREQYFNAATHAFFNHLKAQDRLVVNPLNSAYLDHDSKSQLYPKLSEWGFRVPRSLATNDPGQARVFVEKVGGAVMKPAVGIGSTREVTGQDLADMSELRLCPTLFQEKIKGDTVRVHIVADKVVLALRILSEGFVDSRTSTKGFEYIRLSPQQEQAIVAATQKLGLHYAAWDVIIDGQTGQLAYVDCNPGPFVMWIGQENRRAVFLQLARFLIGYDKTRNLEKAAECVEPYLQ